MKHLSFGLSRDLSSTVRHIVTRSTWLTMVGALLLLVISIRSSQAQEPNFAAPAVQNAAFVPLPPIPPSPATVFGDTPPQDFQRVVPQEHGTSTGYPRRMPWGNGHIVIADPKEAPRLPIFKDSAPESLFGMDRPNLFNRPVDDEWDFSNLVCTDRPDFTDATYTVGRGVTVIESGYTYRSAGSDELNVSRRSLPETLLRVGVTDELELRIKWNGYLLVDQLDKTTGIGTTAYGTDDLILGIKYEFLQQDEWSPMVTFLGGTTIPSGTRGFSVNQTQPYANMVLGWGIRRWLYLKVSTGVDFVKSVDTTHIFAGSLEEGRLVVTGGDNVTEWHQSVSLLYQATKRVGGFVEWFSFFSSNADDNRAAHYVDTGLFFYLTPNVQLDVRYGERLSDRLMGQFAGAGLSIRF